MTEISDSESVFATLSKRQQAIVERLGEGVPLKEITRQLGLAHRTVESHLYRACDRIGVHGVWGLAIWAVERRIRRDLLREIAGSAPPLS